MLSAELNDRERRFCEEYVIDYNGKRAALSAGYSDTNAAGEAYQILRRPEAVEYLSFLKGEQSIRSKVNADYVLSAIVETLERCRQDVKPAYTQGGTVLVVNDKNGEPANAFKFDAKNVLKAAELLGKSLSMFTDVVDQRMTFTQMPEVKIGTATGETKALSFDVGDDPNKPKAIS